MEEETHTRPVNGSKEHQEQLNEETEMEKKEKRDKERVKGMKTPDETKTRLRVELVKTSKPREDSKTKEVKDEVQRGEEGRKREERDKGRVGPITGEDKIGENNVDETGTRRNHEMGSTTGVYRMRKKKWRG